MQCSRDSPVRMGASWAPESTGLTGEDGSFLGATTNPELTGLTGEDGSFLGAIAKESVRLTDAIA